MEPCVVSIGQVTGGTTTNVIPNEVLLRGTMRAMSNAVREQLWVELENALRMSEMMGGSYKLDITKGYPPMINDATANGWMRDVTADLLGESVVRQSRFGMGAEDFAYMTQRAKGAMFMLGAAVPEGAPRHHHTSTFDIDEAVLVPGAAVLAETARRFLIGQITP